MFNLIKKDIITSIKAEGISNIKYLLIILIFYLIFRDETHYITPIFISYLILANTFYCDYNNNARNFIKSMPTSMEDIVYSKYIMGVGTILLVTILCSIINKISSTFFFRSPVLNDLYFSVNIFLLISSFILPIFFKFGYHKVRTLCGVLGVGITIISTSLFSVVSDKVYYLRQYEGVSEGSSTSIGYFYQSTTNIFEKFIDYLYNIDARYVNLNTLTFITLIIFIISMYISLKIVKSKKYNY